MTKYITCALLSAYPEVEVGHISGGSESAEYHQANALHDTSEVVMVTEKEYQLMLACYFMSFIVLLF